MYSPKEIEQKWIDRWEKNGVYRTPKNDGRPKSYVLGMFPYPSGEGLHTGHGRIFTAVDVLARYQRMKGYRVLVPMGWDAFGLPAENAAIKAKKNPMDMVPHNEANFKKQMMMLGLGFDWSRAFSTTDPEYYKWTQWLFLKLYSLKNENGERLIYRKEVPINWCPFCKTGLANEEVESDGSHERCGNQVTEKLLPQWCMRITDYADRLLQDLDDYEWMDGSKKRKGLDWTGGILAMQRNWIGKKEGFNIDFVVAGDGVDEKLTVFTTRPDTLAGVTYLALSVDHELAKKCKNSTVAEYLKEAKSKNEQDKGEVQREKTGVFSGLTAVNPLTGEKVPVWIADYVLKDYGTGVVMGVPSHDERDHDFAIKFAIPIKDKFEPDEKTTSDIVKKNIGRKVTNYHLRDWVFSRQRYWGEPFPLVYCDKCGDENGVVPLSEKDLPLTLPHLQSYEPTETGESPLSRVKDWVQTTCPHCGGSARRETDTMPNWAGSCWYFLYFARKLKTDKTQDLKTDDSKLMDKTWTEEMVSGMEDWLPVDWYLGGAEHAVLHLLYARFWTKAFYDLGLVDFSEPFLRLRSVGMVLAEDGRKMSKSLGNVVNPNDVVEEFGADAVRVYEMFMGPWDQVISWNPRSLIGCRRFVERIWNMANRDLESNWRVSDGYLVMELNKLIVKATGDYIDFKFNTCVAAFMKFVNTWTESKTGLCKADLTRFCQVIAPLTPFVADELWEKLGNVSSIHLSEWPESMKIVEEMANVVVQVNGKTRGILRDQEIESSKIQSEMEKVALDDSNIKKWIGEEKYKIVFVPSRLINFVF